MATRQITYLKKNKGDSWGKELGGSAEKVPVIQAGHVFLTALVNVDVQWKTCVGKVSSKIRLTSFSVVTRVWLIIFYLLDLN